MRSPSYKVTAFMSEHNYVDTFLQVGNGDAHTFYLSPADMHLRLDFFYASADFPCRALSCWHGSTLASCHRPVLLELRA